MNDKVSDEELCKYLGIAPEKPEAELEKYEKGDFSGMSFGPVTYGRPDSEMIAVTVEFPDTLLAAIDRIAEREGVSRSEYIWRSCANEMMASVEKTQEADD